MDVTDDIDYGTLTYYFREALNKASIMKPYLRMYDLRNFETQQDDDYCYLYGLAMRVIDENLLQGNERNLKPSSKKQWDRYYGMSAKGKSKGKWKGETKKGKGKGKDKNKNKNRSNSEPPPKVRQGDCPY